MDSHLKERIAQLLRGYSRRRRVFDWALGMGLLLIALLAAAVFISALSLLYSSPLYYAILKWVALAVLTVAFVKLVLPKIARPVSGSELMRDFDRVAGGLGERVLSASEFIAQGGGTGGNRGGEIDGDDGVGSPVSTELVEAYLGGVSKEIESAEVSRSVPWGELKRLILPVLALAAVTALVLSVSTRDFRAFLFSMSLYPPTAPAQIELAGIDVTYLYPDYSGLDDRSIEATTGDVRAIKGTQVVLGVTPVGREILRPELVLPNGVAVRMESAAEGRVTGGFTLISDGSYYIRDVRDGSRTRDFKIYVDEDASPVVSIESPMGNGVIESEGPGGETIEIDFTARDDYGLSRIALFSRSSAGESTREIERLTSEPESIEDSYLLDAYALDGKPGEVIEVGIVAYDNDGVSQPKAGVSRSLKIRLKDPREAHRDIVESIAGLFERLIDVLGDDVELRPGSGGGGGGDGGDIEGIKEAQSGITKKMRGALDTVSAIVERMEGDQYSDYTLFVGVSGIKENMEEVLNDRVELLKGLSSSDLPRLDGALAREINVIEDAVLFLDAVLKGERFRESLRAGKEMMERYSELDDLLSAYREHGDAETRRAIERKIAEIRSLMKSIASKLAALSQDTIGDYVNLDALNAVNMDETLSKILKRLDDGDVEGAMEMLAKMEEQLQNVVASIGDGMQFFSDSSFSKDITRLGNSIARIKKLQSNQKGIKREAEGVKESMVKNASNFKGAGNSYRERLKGLAERQRELERETSELGGELGSFSESGLFSLGGIGERLGTAGEFMGRASKDLSGGEVSRGISNQGEAVEVLEEALAEAQSMLQEFRMSAKGEGSPAPFVLGRGRRRGYGPGRLDTGYVQLPAEGESERGRELKEGLMRALMEGSPRGYDDLNKRYYERIIK